jgi:hypothetical protein
MASLPFILNTLPETVPSSASYLKAEPHRVQRWRDRLGEGGFKIGVAWQGNRIMPGDDTRSIPVREFAPLAELPGVRLIALQKGFGVEQIAEAPFKERIETFGEDFDADGHFWIPLRS